MKATVEAEWEDGRLVFSGKLWREMDVQVCIHGEKLRWTCDECAEAFGKRQSKRKAGGIHSPGS